MGMRRAVARRPGAFQWLSLGLVMSCYASAGKSLSHPRDDAAVCGLTTALEVTTCEEDEADDVFFATQIRIQTTPAAASSSGDVAQTTVQTREIIAAPASYSVDARRPAPTSALQLSGQEYMSATRSQSPPFAPENSLSSTSFSDLYASDQGRIGLGPTARPVVESDLVSGVSWFDSSMTRPGSLVEHTRTGISREPGAVGEHPFVALATTPERRNELGISASSVLEANSRRFADDLLSEENRKLQADGGRLRERNALLQESLSSLRRVQPGAGPQEAGGDSAADGSAGKTLGKQEREPSLMHCLAVALGVALAQMAVAGCVYIMTLACASLFPRPAHSGPRKRLMLCACSKRTTLYFWMLVIFLDMGFAVLWHYGMIQPFLRQIIVYVYIASAILSIVLLIMYDAWMSMRRKLESGLEIVDFIHDKTDDMLDLLGLQNPEDRERKRHQQEDEDDLCASEPSPDTRRASRKSAGGVSRKGACC